MKKLLKNFVKNFLRPFWFSSRSPYIQVPYFYGNILMTLFFTTIITFIYLALRGKADYQTLGAIGGVIITLGGFYFGTMKLYNTGLEYKLEQDKQKALNPTAQADE